jgi:hypothetical protein
MNKPLSDIALSRSGTFRKPLLYPAELRDLIDSAIFAEGTAPRRLYEKGMRIDSVL